MADSDYSQADLRTAAKLSAKMSDCLAAIKANGALVAWHNGVWAPEIAMADRSGMPVESFTWGTVRALLDRGLVKGNHQAGKYITRVELA